MRTLVKYKIAHFIEKLSLLFELASVLVRFNHVARFIVYANHSIVRRSSLTMFEVRFFPDCCTIMRWQLGANGDGEHFTLIAYGATPDRLVECLEKRVRSQGRNGPLT